MWIVGGKKWRSGLAKGSVIKTELCGKAGGALAESSCGAAIPGAAACPVGISSQLSSQAGNGSAL